MDRPKIQIEYHKDGSLHARGKVLNGVPTGYWEWYRLDGTILRSGYFENGKQTGKWVTYDKLGKPFKETIFQPNREK